MASMFSYADRYKCISVLLYCWISVLFMQVRGHAFSDVTELTPLKLPQATIGFFLVHAPETDWHSAKQICHDVRPTGVPAVLDNHVTLSHVMSELIGHKSHMWLGGYKKDSDWTWLDGSSIPGFEADMETDNCASLYVGPGYKLYTYSDNQYAGLYFCQFSKDQCVAVASPGCSVVYQDDSRCLILCEVASGEVTWYEARDRCVRYGGDLAVMADPAVLETVRNTLAQNNDHRDGVAWLGLRRDSWLWDDQRGRKMVYSWWRAGMPGSGRYDLCLSLNTASNDPGWDSMPCTRALNYTLCQATAPTSVQPTYAVTTHTTAEIISTSTTTTTQPLPSVNGYWVWRFWILSGIVLGLLMFAAVVATTALLCKQKRVTPNKKLTSTDRAPNTVVSESDGRVNLHSLQTDVIEKDGLVPYPVISDLDYAEKFVGETDLPPPYAVVCDYDLPDKEKETPQNVINTLREIYSKK